MACALYAAPVARRRPRGPESRCDRIRRGGGGRAAEPAARGNPGGRVQRRAGPRPSRPVRHRAAPDRQSRELPDMRVPRRTPAGRRGRRTGATGGRSVLGDGPRDVRPGGERGRHAARQRLHRDALPAAHYDSAAMGPGASDDGAPVAAIRETARALREHGPLRNDLVLLLPDGEEDGVLGAEAFAREHSLGRAKGVLLNFEARGAGGPMLLFETSRGNAGWSARSRTRHRDRTATPRWSSSTACCRTTPTSPRCPKPGSRA
ncbi:M28 family peptidase [Actinomadura darangshiensis]|uniref:M28 family peptidase n=1 Tax=Actinomadura darangshiensis TaxID=705336 RepID=A0A4R5BAZ5_9ACTN|nr:M28 family peptidase [Actinomadura darangshiensis]